MKVYLVDSFTDVSFKGNPAGVVIMSSLLDEDLMKKIAKELNQSETAFVYKIEKDIYQVRYFTPTNEVDFCGHATLALSWVLGTNYETMDHLLLKTKAGEIPIYLEFTENHLNQVMMKQVEPKVKDFTGSIDELLKILGITSKQMEDRYQAKLASTGNWDLLLPLKTKKDIDDISPDMTLLKKYQEKHDLISVHLFTQSDTGYYTRNFAPGVGIDEDPVTGSTNGALVGYLYLEGHLDCTKQTVDIIQTNKMGRIGRVHVTLDFKEDKPEIYVSGKAVPILEGEINL